jgi:hypothetical protein
MYLIAQTTYISKANPKTGEVLSSFTLFIMIHFNLIKAFIHVLMGFRAYLVVFAIKTHTGLIWLFPCLVRDVLLQSG